MNLHKNISYLDVNFRINLNNKGDGGILKSQNHRHPNQYGQTRLIMQSNLCVLPFDVLDVRMLRSTGMCESDLSATAPCVALGSGFCFVLPRTSLYSYLLHPCSRAVKNLFPCVLCVLTVQSF